MAAVGTRRPNLRRSILLLGLAGLVVNYALNGLSWVSPLISRRGKAAHHVARAAEGERFKSDDERLSFMNSPIGQALNFVTSALSSSPLNDGKIWLAKMQAGDYDRAVVGSKIDNYLKENPVVLFSFSKCPFCIKAKNQLNEMGAKYLAVELDQMGDEGKQLRAELAERTKRTSMPNIFIAGEGVGGCNDGPGIMTLQKEGRLAPLLQKAGAMR